jgi:hypothetical protein
MKWLFAWLRQNVCQAILSGVADALDQLDGEGQHQQAPGLPEAIRSRLALPAVEAEGNGEAEEVVAAGKRKGKGGGA